METQGFRELQGRFKMSDNFEIFYRRWPAVGSINRVAVFLHGIEVHSGACKFMGPELANDGTEVYAFDRRGFGNSKDPNLPRGDTHDFDRHLKDINEIMEIVHENHTGKKLFLFGHSIGTAYALWYTAHYPQQIDGLVLCSTPLDQGFKLPSSDTLKIAGAGLIRHHQMYNLIDMWPQAFKESEEYKLISQDELCTKQFDSRYLFSVQTKLTNKFLEYAAKTDKPVQILHGDKDIIALPSSSKRIMEKLASKDKNLNMFANADHWLYQTIIPTMSAKYTLEQKRTVSTVVKDWLRKH